MSCFYLLKKIYRLKNLFIIERKRNILCFSSKFCHSFCDGAPQRKCGRPIKSKSKTLLRGDNVEIGREDAYEQVIPAFLITTTLITNVPAFLSSSRQGEH